MSQISKRYLPKDIEGRMYDIFWESLLRCNDKSTFVSFLDDLLTPTEKVMLAKRVVIAFLLLKNYDYESINKTLRVSNQTIWTVKTWLALKGKGYKKVLTSILTDEKWSAFWQKLDATIFSILFPTPGKGVNWRNARKQEWIEKMSKRKTF